MEDYQTLFNVAVMAAGGAYGWILNSIWRMLGDSQKTEKELTRQISNIEVLVAGSYVKREELGKQFADINHRLDEILEKLNGR